METGNLILLVFETETAMYATLQHLLIRPGFGDFAAFVASSTIGRLRENFMDWWYIHEGEIRPGAPPTLPPLSPLRVARPRKGRKEKPGGRVGVYAPDTAHPPETGLQKLQKGFPEGAPAGNG